MAGRLAVELSAKPDYLQFRIVGADDEGRELVRVDRSGANNAVRIVPEQELQKKGGKDYMAATMALRDGEIYESPIDVNREHGVIERPLTPVLRLATPIYSDDGIPIGALIVNMDMRPIFDRIRSGNTAGALSTSSMSKATTCFIPTAAENSVSNLGGGIAFKMPTRLSLKC